METDVQGICVISDLIDAVGRQENLDGIYDAALSGLKRALAIERAAILLFDEHGVMRFRAWRGLSERYRAQVEGHTPWARGVSSRPSPIVVPDVTLEPTLARYRDLFAEERIRGLAFIPLLYRDELLGKFMLYFNAPRTLSIHEVWLVQAIAQLIAFAVVRKRTEERLEESDRSKTQFLALLSHELRNPLAPMRGAVDLLRMRQGGAFDERAVGVLERHLKHLTRLLDDLLDLARISSGKIAIRKEVVDLSDVVARALEDVSQTFERKGLSLQVSVPEGVRLMADPVRLEQVLRNLLDNAAKFTSPGGSVSVFARRDGPEVVIGVRDTGVGVPSDVLPRIFEPFVQARGSVGRSNGLGLGLYLVRELVKLHGGSVEAESGGPGQGSEFRVRLPLEGTVAQHSPSAPSRRRRAMHILVVDDNQDAADVLAALLESSGHQVRVAYDAESALQVAASFRPDVAFIDLLLPSMDGYELARRLREAPGSKDTVLVALSGLGQAEDIRRSHEVGFRAHLIKPVDIARIEELLTELEPAVEERASAREAPQAS